MTATSVKAFLDKYIVLMLITGLLLISLKQHHELQTANDKIMAVTVSSNNMLKGLEKSQLELLKLQRMISRYECQQSKVFGQLKKHYQDDAHKFHRLEREFHQYRGLTLP